MQIKITPSKLKGEVKAIPSKSYLHRALLMASLTKGKSIIKNAYISADIKATIDACLKFGANISVKDDVIEVIGCTPDFKENEVFDIGESGSTLRFLIPILLTVGKPFIIDGHNRVKTRPLDEYFHIFDEKGIKYEHGLENLPLKVDGKLEGGDYALDGDVSSQFITGLLIALSQVKDKGSKLIVRKKMESKDYVSMTMEVMEAFGASLSQVNNTFYIPSKQKFVPANYVVQGDYSQAAFFLCSTALGNEVSITGLDIGSQQGDKVIIDCLNQMGYQLKVEDGRISLDQVHPMKASIDLANCPDLGPILFTLAATRRFPTRFTNAKRLAFKESNRILDVKEELEKIGAIFNIDEDDEIYVQGFLEKKDCYHFNSHNDHRIAMSLAILSTILEGKVIIDNIEAINKSYPTFIEDFVSLGGQIENE